MLSKTVFVAANALKSKGLLGAGLVQASHSLHTSSQSLAPLPPLPETGGKVRHGIFPEEIFQLLYPKTGVTGPYMLGTGLFVYLLSKEIYVLNHETLYALSIGSVLIYGIKKFGPSVAAFADKLNADKVAKVQEFKDLAVNNIAEAIVQEKSEQWKVEGRSMLFDAKRNNVAVLLETNFRERIHMVTNEVKKRMDYQIALQNLHRQMEQEHMVNWVEKSVIGSITPQQEKESIAKCISDLNALAKARATDEPNNAPWQRSNSTSRPSGKTIYSQRKEHIETLNKQDKIHYRVEHLFTCELNAQGSNSLDDCVAKLKTLDAKGRLWPQEMILDVQGGYLQLNDIETKAELESLPLGSILQTKAVLDSCAYDSLLTVTVQERYKKTTQVYMFQCEEVGAEFIKSDLDRVVQGKPADVDNNGDQFNTRNDLENIIGQRAPESFRKPGPRAMLERSPSPPEDGQWSGRDLEPTPVPRIYTPPPQYNAGFDAEPQDRQEGPPMTESTDINRDMEIFNHVLGDVEVFMGMIAAAHPIGLPPVDQCVGFLQKVKYGFNLLGKLNGLLTTPSAADYVHILFTSLQIVVPQYAPDISTKVVSPMLTEVALQLLAQEVSPEEDKLWRALGDCWNVPRTRWPGGDAIPPYLPEFYDGWRIPPQPSSQMGPRSLSQHFPPPASHQGSLYDHQGPLYDHQGSREMQGPPEEVGAQKQAENSGPNNISRGGPPPPLYMRVIYDFMARNSQELSVLKGEVVRVVDKSNQWWIVCNNHQEEGHVPQKVLEHMNEPLPMDYPQGSRGGPPPLDMTSSSGDVRAWLEYKSFSKITVQSLSVLNGKLLLSMSREDMRTVCPEEGGKVFFHLQSIKSAVALASEPGYGPNGRY
ncbi:hypothetical protein NHX12_012250 [Muraenolepis orangiensis]|uniref:ATP synthase peripheral stalk subunit b, mitochondrial n=1 Tax=Muraenolepis orangiensis TaxID=630683 RepID=A0A9Q0DFS6_9TELE|nr:hypothetical protein NHX12_012250 [Muraenolepis orangiensis]